ncbi:sensor histidine kinase [Pannonibacter sp. SL95]|uniref:sensor histidine kinase n=1 Tax=Pannonibacter sp. SL95 TaxID=2995153 RepID=UPI0022767C44|nr:sensor histidine kinase [Pannonibacter sp. SL95]MCY1706921.1 sensor histidine kinase [Pannonibacter sp. SL95]
MSHRLTWQNAGQPEAQMREYLLLALERSGVCVMLQSASLEYLYLANLPDCWHFDSAKGAPSDASLFGADLARRLRLLKQEVLAAGEMRSLDAATCEDGLFHFRVEQVAGFGAEPHLLTTIVDLTEKTRREKVLRALLREVSHRSKNLLAIIQSLAAQTARRSTTLDQFLAKFRGRLFSLAQSQDLVTQSNWHGAQFKELVRHQVERYMPQNGAAVEVLGEDVLLDPNAALHVGLALHELTVNAVSYGTAVTSGPPVTVRCSRLREDGHEMLEIIWLESVTPGAAEDPSELRSDGQFGSTVLERVVPAAINGRAEYHLTPRLVSYRLVFPAEWGEVS